MIFFLLLTKNIINNDILNARFAFIAQYVILKPKLLRVPLSLIGKIFYRRIRDLEFDHHLPQNPIFFRKYPKIHLMSWFDD